MMKTLTQNLKKVNRRGFTLIELLVVISIILIILSMTVAAFSFARESDRVSSEASRIQSFLAGARDRAIYNDEMRGVRMFVEPAPPGSPPGASAFSRTVTSMAYIAPGGTWSAPVDSSGIDLMRIDGNILNQNPKSAGLVGVDADGDFEDAADLLIKVRGSNNPGWWNLKRRGWLVDGLRMRIPAGPTGNWYTINTGLIDTTVAPTDDQFLILDIPYADGGNRGQEVAWENLTYEIELPPRILPQEPVLLAEGVVIDLDGSSVPDIWRPASTGNSLYSGYMDIWFSPRGNVIGEAAAKGVLHFYVCDAEDSLFLKEELVKAIGLGGFDATVGSGTAFIPLDEIDPSLVGWLTWDGNYIVKDRRLVTLFAQTGAISVNKVNAYVGTAVGGNPDANNDGIADDPFRFAETGEVAK
ncbi:MAG: prepilin-type N-terminal cleavage/methylation domain-containing protein [Fuerstiella sp.]